MSLRNLRAMLVALLVVGMSLFLSRHAVADDAGAEAAGPRSEAVQTFVVQLAGGGFGYLPTRRSVEGGAYGPIPESTVIGPKGGRELVEQTLALIASLWDES